MITDDFINPEHQGADRELLRTFYEACEGDGGTMDEITLRGIRAVLALAAADKPAAVAPQATGQPRPLSPAAQAVLDAANGASSYGPDDCLSDAREIATAVVRALVDHVVPHEQPESRRGMRPGGTGALTLDEAQGFQRAATRRKLLAIAAELEGADG